MTLRDYALDYIRRTCAAARQETGIIGKLVENIIERNVVAAVGVAANDLPLLAMEFDMQGAMKFLIPALDFAISILSMVAPSTPSDVDDRILSGLKTVRAWLGGGATTTLHEFAAQNPVS